MRVKVASGLQQPTFIIVFFFFFSALHWLLINRNPSTIVALPSNAEQYFSGEEQYDCLPCTNWHYKQAHGKRRQQWNQTVNQPFLSYSFSTPLAIRPWHAHSIWYCCATFNAEEYFSGEKQYNCLPIITEWYYNKVHG